MTDVIEMAEAKLQNDKAEAMRDLKLIVVQHVDGAGEGVTPVDADTIAWATTNAGVSMDEFRKLVDACRERKRLLAVVEAGPQSLLNEVREIIQQQSNLRQEAEESAKNYDRRDRELGSQVSTLRGRMSDATAALTTLKGMLTATAKARATVFHDQIEKLLSQREQLRQSHITARAHHGQLTGHNAQRYGTKDEVAALVEAEAKLIADLQSRITELESTIQATQAERQAFLTSEALRPDAFLIDDQSSGKVIGAPVGGSLIQGQHLPGLGMYAN